MLNLSLAVNRALGGIDVGGYHVFNLIVHCCNAMLVFAFVERTLRCSSLVESWRGRSGWIGFAVAGIWALHPIQTESVTYVVQRVEAMVSLFYLVVLYSLNRAATPGCSRWWTVVAVVACWLGMATKEVMVTAPVVALFYDHTFLAGSWQAALRVRSRLYVGLASSWGLLAVLIGLSGSRGGSVGFGVGVGPFEYGQTQCFAIVRYLRLAVWPGDLTFDYGTRLVSDLHEVAVPAGVMVVLLALTLWCVRHRPATGFAMFFFFLVLAPTSSVVPVVTQVVAEHRSYLALLGPITLAVMLLFAAMPSRLVAVAIAWAVALALGRAAYERNRDYRSATAIWADTVAKRPENIRARISLGLALVAGRDFDGAVVQWTEAIRLDPRESRTHYVIGNALSEAGRHEEAIAKLRETVRLEPDYAAGHYDLGNELARHGDFAVAAEHYRCAIAIGMTGAAAQNNLGSALLQQGLVVEAIEAFRAALNIEPDNFVARVNLGAQYLQRDQAQEALPHLQAAVALTPDSARAGFLFAEALAAMDRDLEAISALENVVKVDPQFPMAAVALRLARQRAGVALPESRPKRTE